MKCLFLLILLFSLFLSQAETEMLDGKTVRTKTLYVKVDTKAELKRTKKSPKKNSEKKLTLEEVSKSTAFIISGIGNNMTTGSGFFITKSLLVTNSHVVESAVVRHNIKIVTVETQQGIKDVGFVFAEDRKNDLAIIKTIKKTHKYLKPGKYNEVKMGDEIFVLGSPQGFVGTLSKGIVSAKRKGKDFQMLQITAPISLGSSGSPVLSKDLKVIGIVVALLKRGQNINFAVPVTYLKKLIKANKKKLVQIDKLNLEKIVKDNKAITPVESEELRELRTYFEKGFYYYEKKDDKQAVYWFRKAAKKGHIGSQFLLGMIYYEGIGIPKDYKQAVYWFKKAASQGYMRAQILLGMMYYRGEGVSKDYKQAFYWSRKAADRDSTFAQRLLGIMYYEGQGVSKDYKQAFYWFKKAGRKGDVGAQASLGKMYYEGQGVSKDYKQAFYWSRKAAVQGHINAQFSLGLMYYNGRGIPQNFVYAHLWWNLAAANGDKEATELRNMISVKMSAHQIAVAQQLSTKIAQEIDQRQMSQRQIASE